MTTKVKPVTRQEILNLAVTDVDPFGAQRYLRHRENIPALPDLEEKGQQTLPGVEGVLCDLYHTLWTPEPGVKEEVAPDRKYWKELLCQTIKSAAYEKLHSQTQLKELESVLGTIAVGESVLATIPEKDKKQLQELTEAQEKTNQAGQQTAEAQANANASRQLAQAAAQAANQAAEQANQQPGNTQTQAASAQAQAITQQLAQQASQAQAGAQAAQMNYEQAKALANELAEQLMGKPGSEEAQQRSEQLRRMGMAATKQAQAKVQEVSDTIQAWGLEPGELTRESFAEVQAILERIKRNPHLKQFSRLLGRLRMIAARKAKSKDRGEGVRVTTTETGHDLKRAVPSELVALTHPALRVKALVRWARSELRLRGQKTRRKLGHGPVVVCEDASGSMDGVKQQWTKALVLALAYFARLQKRSFGWVLFDAYVHQSKTYPQGAISAKDMIEIAESRAGGGTDFEQPLRKAVEMIQKEGLRKADILLVTDGMCAISDAFLKELKSVKKALEVQIFTVLVNVGETTDATVKEFSDRIIPISDLTAEEAERKVIGIL